MAQLVLMLYASANDNEELAKAHAPIGAVRAPNKLSMRLFLETYKECCDLSSEGLGVP